MSYDVYLNVDGGAGHGVCAFDRNMTSNVAPMWRKAGVDLREFQGLLAGRVIDSLNAAIDNMTNYPEDYRAMNPENGWGSYEGALDFLTSLRDACQKFPRAEIGVSY